MHNGLSTHVLLDKADKLQAGSRGSALLGSAMLSRIILKSLFSSSHHSKNRVSTRPIRFSTLVWCRGD